MAEGENDYIAQLRIVAENDEKSWQAAINETKRKMKELQAYLDANPGTYKQKGIEQQLASLRNRLTKQQAQMEKSQSQYNARIQKLTEESAQREVKVTQQAQQQKVAAVQQANKEMLAANREYYNQLLKIKKLEQQGNLSSADKKALNTQENNITTALKNNTTKINDSGDISAIEQQRVYEQVYQTQQAIITAQENQRKKAQEIKDAYSDVLVTLREISRNEQEISQLESKKHLNNDEKERLTTLKQQTGELQEQYNEKMKIVGQDDRMLNKAKQATREYQQQTKEINKQNSGLETTQTHTKGLLDSIKNIGRYVLMYQALNAIQTGVQKAYETITELDKAFTDIQLVTGDTDEEINQLSEDYNDLAKQMGATTQQVAEGASEWFNESRDHVKVLELLETP